MYRRTADGDEDGEGVGSREELLVSRHTLAAGPTANECNSPSERPKRLLG